LHQNLMPGTRLRVDWKRA